jgi:hypothetical protein
MWDAYPAPNANEAEYQRDALDALRKGTLPTGFTAEGYFCKKGEKVIYAFNDVIHYCSIGMDWPQRGNLGSHR